MSLCKNCGNELTEGDTVCSVCNEPVSEIEADNNDIDINTDVGVASDTLTATPNFFDKNTVITITLIFAAAFLALLPHILFKINITSGAALPFIFRLILTLAVVIFFRPKGEYMSVRTVATLFIFAVADLFVLKQTPAYFNLFAVVAASVLLQSDSEHKNKGILAYFALDGILSFITAQSLYHSMYISMLCGVIAILKFIYIYIFEGGIIRLSRTKAIIFGIVSIVIGASSAFAVMYVKNKLLFRVIVNGRYLHSLGAYMYLIYTVILTVWLALTLVVRAVLSVKADDSKNEKISENEIKDEVNTSPGKLVYGIVIAVLVAVVALAGYEVNYALKIIGIEPQSVHVCNNIKSTFANNFDFLDCTIDEVNPEVGGITYVATLNVKKDGDAFSGTIKPHYTKGKLLYKPDALGLGDIRFDRCIPSDPPDDAQIRAVIQSLPVVNASGNTVENFSYDNINYEFASYDVQNNVARITVNDTVDCGNYIARLYQSLNLVYTYNFDTKTGSWTPDDSSPKAFTASIISKASVTQAQVKSVLSGRMFNLNDNRLKYLKGSNITNISDVSVTDNSRLDCFNVSASISAATEAYNVSAKVAMVFSYNNGQYVLANDNIELSDIEITQSNNTQKLRYSGKSQVTSANNKYDLDNKTISLTDFVLYNGNRIKFKYTFSVVPYDVYAGINDNGVPTDLVFNSSDNKSYSVLDKTNADNKYTFTLSPKDMSTLIDDYGNFRDNVTLNFSFNIYDTDTVSVDGTVNLVKN